MLIGYARTSTLEQEAGLEAQVRDLQGLGCEKVFAEQTSATGKRPVLEQALAFARKGDTVCVTKLDRLARSVKHLGDIRDDLEKRGVHLRIVNLGVDTASATGKLVLTMIGGIAEFERDMMLERQREGIAKAKSEGRYKGRKATARAKADKIKALSAEGLSQSQIAKQVGVSKASVQRLLKGGNVA